MQNLAELMPKMKRSALTYDEFLKVRTDFYNSNPGELSGYNCSKCLNHGYIAQIKDGVEVMVECDCMKKREALKRLEKSGISENLKEKSFSTFRSDEPFQLLIKNKAAEFVKGHSGKWFFIGGQTGCGKTHICTAIAGQLLKLGENLRYMLWAEESALIKARINDTDYKEIISGYQFAEVLYIDDLFKETATEADIRLAFQILDYRYRRRMCTIISSEHTLNEIYSTDKAVGGRIAEMSVKINIQPDRNKDFRLK